MALIFLLLAVIAAGLGGYALLVRLGLDDFEAWCGGRLGGLIVVAMPAWWAGVAGVRHWTTVGAVVLVALAAAGLFSLRRRRPWRQLLAAEAVFTVFAAAVLFLRLDHPEIIQQEKSMDLGIFASLLRAEGFPPPDMWLAGEALPYYYWGALLWTVPIALSRLPLELAYNLVVALAGGITAALLWAVGRRLGGGHRWGLAVAFFGLLAGTPDGLRQLLGGVPLAAVDIWHSSRQVADTITEFPLFTFWLGDLHPHLLAMPIAVLAVLVALEAGSRGPDAPRVAALAVLFGVGWAANPWSMPPTLAAIALLLLAADRRWYWPVGEGRRRWLAVVVVAAGGWLVTAPFHLGFQPFFDGIGMVTAWTSPLDLLLYAGCLVVPALLAAIGLLGTQVSSADESGRAAMLLAGAAVAILAAVAARPTLVLLAAILVVLVIGVFRVQEGRGRPGLALAALGVFLLLVPEIVYVADGYGDALHRMNTVFKAYIQGWVFLALALPAMLRWGLPSRGRRAAALAVMVAVAAVHPASLGLRQLEAPHLGLDGMRWLDPGDRAIVEALRKEPVGAVLIEAVGDAYTEYARLSAASGVPAYLGWENHELVWRGSSVLEETGRRKALIDALYSSGDPAEVRRLAAEAGADLIAIGSLERRDYGPSQLAAVAAAGEPVVEHGEALLVRITP